MELITIRFDKVFDIARHQSQDRRPGTLFSFESESGKEFGINAPGNPALRDGMTVSAILRKAEKT